MKLNNSDKEHYSKYIHQLITIELLIPEYFLSITGTANAEKIRAMANQYQIPSLLSTLKFLDDKVSFLKNSTIHEESLETLMELESHFNSNKIQLESNQVIQVHLNKTAQKSFLDKCVVSETLDAMIFCLKLNGSFEQNSINEFRKVFQERYGDREVELSHVLDDEIGLGYPIKQQNDCIPSILKDVPQKDSDLNTSHFSDTDMYLTKLCVEATEQKKFEIDLNQYDFTSHFKLKDDSILPPSFSALISTNYLNDKLRVEVIAAGGTSATPLISRFSTLNKSIEHLCQNICSHEEKSLEDYIIAEIVHVPDARSCNVLHRSILSNYEIPVYSNSNLPCDRQILVSDLLLSLHNNTFVLRSKSLNKFVYPRLSSAYNYFQSTIPAFRFLCDFQYHQKRHIMSFQWGKQIGLFTFLPRVTYKGVILKPAIWNLAKSACHNVTTSKNENLLNAISELRLKHNIPRFIGIMTDENELVLDLENPLCQKLLKRELKKRNQTLIQEKIFSLNDSPVKSNEGLFCNEFTICFNYNKQQNKISTKIKATHPKFRKIFCQAINGFTTNYTVMKNMQILFSAT